MKTCVIFLLSFIGCVSTLSCYTSVGNTRKQCSPNDRFCSSISIVEGYSGDLPMIFQGCSHDIRNIYDAPCENTGVSDVFQKGGHRNSWHAVLSCCHNNYCNSATTFSMLLSLVFVIFLNVFFSIE